MQPNTTEERQAIEKRFSRMAGGREVVDSFKVQDTTETTDGPETFSVVVHKGDDSFFAVHEYWHEKDSVGGAKAGYRQTYEEALETAQEVARRYQARRDYHATLAADVQNQPKNWV